MTKGLNQQARILPPSHLISILLYDSINPTLAITALKDAMSSCRPDWSPVFISWLLDLINLSLESSFGEYLGKFFKLLFGLPTGGSLIVQIANVTVFYVLKCVLYSDKVLMKEIVSMKRYIDDGIGIHTMTKRRFEV